MKAIGRIAAALSLLLVGPLTAGALAQTSYPDQPVRILVGFTPGTAPDVSARILADKFTEASSMRLRKDLSRENLDARYPDSLYVGFAAVGRRQFAGLDSLATEALRKGARFVIARNERISRRFIQADP